jgi:hypothetical protein
MSETMSNTAKEKTETTENINHQEIENKTIDSTESVENTNESIEKSEGDKSSDFVSSQASDNTAEDESVDKFPDEFNKRIGSVLTADRKRERAKSEAQIAQLQNQINSLTQGYVQPNVNAQAFGSSPQQNGMIQDPVSKKYYVLNSNEGQVLLQEQQFAALQQEREFARQGAENQKKVEAFEDRMIEAKLAYPDFDHSVEALKGSVSVPMVNALVNTDIPAAIINYLGTNPTELDRFKKLSPEKQVKEVYKLEDKLAGSNRKLSTNAKPPIQGIDASRNTGATRETQSLESRKAELRKHYWKGT